MKRNTLFKRLMLILSISSIIIFLILLFSIIKLRIADKNIISIFNDRIIPLKQLKVVSDEYNCEVLRIAQKYDNGIISRDSALQMLNYSTDLINQNWKKYITTYLTDEEKEQIRKTSLAKKKADQLIEYLKILINEKPEPGNEKMFKKIVHSELLQTMEPLTKQINVLVSIQINEADNLVNTIRDIFNQLPKLAILILVMCILLIWFMISRRGLEKIIAGQTKELENKNQELNLANEELQTNIDELDVANEELISTNEELNSINEQLEQHKNQLEALVTERTQDLRKSEARFKSIFDNANDAIVILKDGSFTDCNAKTLELFGCSFEEFVGKNPFDFSPPKQPDDSDSKQKASELISLASSGTAQRFEWLHIRFNDKKEFNAEVTTSRLELENDIFLLAVIRDITERKLYERTVAEEQAKLMAVVESTDDLIFAVDSTDLRVIMINSAAKKYYADRNYHVDIGSRIEDMFFEVRVKEWRGYYNNLLKNGAFHTEYSTTDKLIDFIVSFYPLVSNGTIFGISVFLKDITEIKQTQAQLAMFKKYIDIAPLGAYWMDKEGRIVYVNETGCEMLGYKSDELLKMNISEINVVVGKNPERWQSAWRTLQENRNFISESIHRRKDGTEFPVEVTTSLFTYGEHEYCNGFAWDITERKTYEENLKEKIEYLRIAQDLAQMGTYVIDLPTRNITLSVEMAKIYGAGNSEITYPLDDYRKKYYHPDDLKEKPERADNTYKEGKTLFIESRVIRTNGEIIWVQANSSVVQNGSKIVGLIQNITEKKNAEKALKENEEHLQYLLDSVTDYIYNANIKDGKVTETKYGEGCKTVTGYHAKDFVNNENLWIEIVYPEDKETVLKQAGDILQKHIAEPLEHRIITKEGDIKWVRNTPVLRYNLMNEPDGYDGLIADITERKLMEQQMLNSIVETEEHERVNFSQELHDGLGPLISAIKMYIQLLSMPGSNIEPAAVIGDMEKLIEESSRTIREISFKLSPHILQNYGIIEAISAYVEKIKETKKLDIQFKHNEICRCPTIIETVAYRVLCECVNNTVKHAKATRIDINIDCTESVLEIQYSDNGKGFDVEKVMNSRKGIGLLNMQSRVKSVNGSMVIRSALTFGTTVVLKIKMVNN